ncbi:MAG: ABC transporter substrate-binding protein [Acidimicrobiia bacterium]
MRATTVKRILGLLAGGAVLLAACGDDEPDAADDTPAGEEADAPERIVSLSPALTEMLFAVGAGDQVVAVDDQSNYPDGVPTTDLSGYQPNVEAIAGYEPDLVVASSPPEDMVRGLEDLGIEVLDLPAAQTLEDTYAQLAELGVRTGNVDGAAEVVADMRAEIDELLADLPERDEPLTYYHELDDMLFSITSSTFIGELYSLAGLENVADAADPKSELGGYPQLSSEFLVDADPDIIFLADTVCCGQDADTLAARPGFSNLTAVAEGRVVELDDDVASRWGPRVVDLLRAIVEATAAVPA